MPYPYKKYNYTVVIGNLTQAGFSEVSAANTEVQPIEYREGNDKRMTVGKLSGLVKYSNVTLKWGSSSNKEFTDWVAGCADGKTERKEVKIQLMDDTNTQVLAEWKLADAWPTRYTAPDFKATDNEVAYESIELCHEGLSRTK